MDIREIQKSLLKEYKSIVDSNPRVKAQNELACERLEEDWYKLTDPELAVHADYVTAKLVEMKFSKRELETLLKMVEYPESVDNINATKLANIICVIMMLKNKGFDVSKAVKNYHRLRHGYAKKNGIELH